MGLVLLTAGLMFAAAVVVPRLLQLPPDVPPPKHDMRRTGSRILVVLGLLTLVLGYWATR